MLQSNDLNTLVFLKSLQTDSEVILFLSFKLLGLILVNLARNIYAAATSNYVKIP